MRSTAQPATRLLLAAGMGLWLAVGLLPPPRPDPVPLTAPAAEFSAERAMVHVRAIAERPHPVGSPDHARVRAYIVSEFLKLGVVPEIQRGEGEFARRGATVSAAISNVVARLPGSANTRPVMLVAHYDSVRSAPGAADDAHAVATLLETLRALRSSPKLRNDVLFLITDAEEPGLLGAEHFMRHHPWRTEPGIVLNFEARGTGGTVTMFETSLNNLWLVRELQAAVPAAQAHSLEYEIYRRMPNSTDLTMFKMGGLAGMNFAFIDGAEYYHTPQDDPAHLDRRSLQEQGGYALSLARRFGGMDLRDPPLGAAVYFATRLTGLIVYPASWVMPLALLTAAAVLLAAWIACRRRTRGRWIAFALAVPAAAQFYIANAVPGASYMLHWPLLAGAISLALLATAPETIAPDLRAALLSILPAVPFLIVAPMFRHLIIIFGPDAGAPMLAAPALLIVLTILPQTVLLLRNRV